MYSEWPPFVTLRDEDTAGRLTKAVWDRCSTEWQAETMTEKFWREKGWVTLAPLQTCTHRPLVAAHMPPSSQSRAHDCHPERRQLMLANL